MKKTISRLNHLLSASTVLSQKARLCHWNYEGFDFVDMHERFEEIYTYFSDLADVLAERIRALDAFPKATFAEYIKTTEIKEKKTIKSDKMIQTLIKDISHITGELRTWLKNENDVVTESIFMDTLTELEKKLWMLKSSGSKSSAK